MKRNNSGKLGLASSFVLHGIVLGGIILKSLLFPFVGSEENKEYIKGVLEEKSVLEETLEIPVYYSKRENCDEKVLEVLEDYLSFKKSELNSLDVELAIKQVDYSVVQIDERKILIDLEFLLKEVEKYPHKSVEDITEVYDLEKGIKKRAYEPIEGIDGEVDSDSLIPYEYAPILKNGKIVGYNQVLVDKDGRSFKIKRSLDEMNSSDYMSMRMLEMAKKNPNMRKILNSVYGSIDNNLK